MSVRSSHTIIRKPIFLLDASKSLEDLSIYKHEIITTPTFWNKEEGFIRFESGSTFELNTSLIDSCYKEDYYLLGENPDSEYTIEFLFRWDGDISSNADSDRILVLGNSDGGLGVQIVKSGGNRLSFGSRGSGEYLSNKIIDKGEWYFISIIRGVNNSIPYLKIIINGELDKVAQNVQLDLRLTKCSNNFKIGNISDVNIDGQNFVGDFSFLRVYDFAINTKNAILNGNSLKNRFIREEKGYVVNLPTHLGTTSSVGVELPDNKTLSDNNGSYTIMVRIKLNHNMTNTTGTVFDIGDDSISTSIRTHCYINWEESNKRYKISGIIAGLGSIFLNENPIYPNGSNIFINERRDGEWVDIFWTHNNITGEGFIYHNNKEIWGYINNTQTGKTYKTVDPHRSIFRGSDDTNHINAPIKYFATWSKVLSINEIKNITSSIKYPSDIPSCTCLLDFNSFGSSVIPDKSGNSNNGNIILGTFSSEDFFVDASKKNIPDIESNPDNFICVVDTSLTETLSSPSASIILPLYEPVVNTNDFIVHWGDGTSEHHDDASTLNSVISLITHTYSTPGVYTIIFEIKNAGGFIYNQNQPQLRDRLKLIEIKQWGKMKITSTVEDFFTCINLDVTASDTPILENSNFSNSFRGCRSLTGFNPNLDTSSVTNMNSMFADAPKFNADVSNWDVSNVTDFGGMFNGNVAGNSLFNQDLSKWNVTNVCTNTSFMFYRCINFNAEIGNWDVSSVTNMTYMLSNCRKFNGDISGWDTSSVQNMNAMFFGADIFNQDISGWDVGSVSNFGGMFNGADNFDQDLSSWDISEAINMTNFALSANFSTCNYDKMLIAWDNLPSPPQGVSFAINAPLTNGGLAQTAKNNLINTHGWIITDGGTVSPLTESPPNSFISQWNTNNTSSGSSNSNQVKLPLLSSGDYNFLVYWGDGAFDYIDTWNQTEVTHTYSSSGTYTISISGKINGFQFNNTGDRLKLLDVSDWGNLKLTTSNVFYGCSNLNFTAINSPIIETTSFNLMFFNCTNFNSDIDHWDVEKVLTFNQTFGNCNSFNKSLNSWNMCNTTSISQMFRISRSFNQDLDNWDTRSIINMGYCFQDTAGLSPFNGNITTWDTRNVENLISFLNGCRQFNQDISKWKVHKVTNFFQTFNFCVSFTYSLTDWRVKSCINMVNFLSEATLFNSDISSWDVSNVTDMGYMFNSTPNFDSDLSSWDVSNVTNMSGMFRRASVFDSDLSFWDVGSVSNMQLMFNSATNFNQDLSSWDVSNVINMNGMFNSATNFNSDLSSWDVSNVTNMSGMFRIASVFDSDLSSWNVSNVTDMQLMFELTSNFNSDISSWTVSNVTNMSSMFRRASVFDSDLSFWDVSNVTNMQLMFQRATNFNQDLSSWDVSNVTNMAFMFDRSTNFNQDLSSWTVSNVTNMTYMFRSALFFDSDLSSWDVSNVTNMSGMFNSASNFNSDLSSWDVSNVINMNAMFNSATNFNSDLSSWDISNVTDMRNFGLNTNFTTSQYDSMLIAWNNLANPPQNIDFNINAKYTTSISGGAHTNLQNTHGWTIVDGGYI